MNNNFFKTLKITITCLLVGVLLLSGCAQPEEPYTYEDPCRFVTSNTIRGEMMILSRSLSRARGNSLRV